MLLEKEIKGETQVRSPEFEPSTVTKLTPFVTKPKARLHIKGHILGIRQFQQAWRQEKQSLGVLLNENQAQRNPVNHRDCWHLIVPVCPDSLHLVPTSQKLLTCWHKNEVVSEKAMLLTTLLPNCSNLLLHHATKFAWYIDCQIL